MANTASLADLIVAECSISDNRSSGSGKLLDTGNINKLRAIGALTNVHDATIIESRECKLALYY